MAGSDTPVQDVVNLSYAILILLSLVITILFVSYFLQKHRIHFIHESVVSIVLGMIVGGIIRLTSHSEAGGQVQNLISFDYRAFFNLLLPPIILHSGYDIHRTKFFKNFGAILVFSIAGTFISTAMIGIAIWTLSIFGLHHLSFIDCIMFGAILSSTDPVTVLAIFGQLQVDEKLYSLIFGESILNDSVAIVLFSVLGKLKSHVSLFTIVQVIYLFICNFVGSVAIGVVFALFVALVLKHTDLDKFASLESCIVLLFAYLSYIFSNAIEMSGIVSLLFCALILKHYAYDNMSLKTRRTTKYMCRVLSQLSENFIFIYLGVTLFTKADLEFSVLLIIATIVLEFKADYSNGFSLLHCYSISRVNQHDGAEMELK